MYWLKTLCFVAVLPIFLSGTAFSQSVGHNVVSSKDQGVQPVSYLDCDIQATENCCEPSDGCHRCGCCGELGDPWTLFAKNCCGIEVGGWVSGGIIGNAYGDASNGPLGFNTIGDGFTIDQVWAYAEKVADTGGCGTDWGFRIDYIFGTDGPGTQAFGGHGWDTQWNTSRDYGSAMPQLYGEVAFNDLSVKVGHFFTIIGWEVVPDTGNFFYTHSYTMYYAEPFTHTGVLAKYDHGGDITVHGGWVQGWDTGFDNTPRADMFLGGLSIPLTERLKAAWACTAGSFGAAAGNVYMNSLVFELALSDKWTYILQHDLGVNSGLGAHNNKWYGVNQYLQYQINDRWAVGARAEWFDDPDGDRISFNGPAQGSYYEMTFGLNWRPSANLIVRPELRYDWFNGTAAAGDLPFNSGRNSDQFSGGFDFIFTF